jgi:hypothetical protein
LVFFYSMLFTEYTLNMGLKIVLSVVPVMASCAAAIVFNALDVSPVVAVAILALIATISGAAIGVFWPVSSETPKWMKAPRRTSPRP